MNILNSLRMSVLCLIATGFLFTASCSPDARPATSEKAATTETVPVAELIAQADKLYAQREDLARVREALGVLRRVRAVDGNNYEAAWRAARFNYFLGDHTTDEKERETAFRDGVAAGAVAVRAQPGRPEGHFWYGANLGGKAMIEGPLSGLATVKDIRREMEAVLKVDESYLGGSAYMALGRLDRETPKILGGDSQRAVETLEKGLRVGGDNALLRLRLAEAYLDVKRPEDARKQINAILTMKPNPDFIPEYKDAVKEARQLLARRF